MDNVMVTNLALVGYLAPLSLIVVALMVQLNRLRSVDQTFKFGRALTIGSFVLSLFVGAIVLSPARWSARCSASVEWAFLCAWTR